MSLHFTVETAGHDRQSSALGWAAHVAQRPKRMRVDRRLPACAVALAITGLSFYYLLFAGQAADLQQGGLPGDAVQVRLIALPPPELRQLPGAPASKAPRIASFVKAPGPLLAGPTADDPPGVVEPDVPTHAPGDALPAAPLNLTPSAAAMRGAIGVASLTRQHIAEASPNDGRSALERAMDQGAKPGCMSADALKHEPPQLLGIGVSGILVVPSWLKAAVTGKCKSS